MNKKILVNNECFEEHLPIFSGSHCGYIFHENLLSTFESLLKAGVRNFSYYSINENIEQLFNTLISTSNRFTHEILNITVWCDLSAQNTHQFLISATDFKADTNHLLTLGIYVPSLFFTLMTPGNASSNMFKIVENTFDIAKKHGTEYEKVIEKTKSCRFVNTVELLPLLINAKFLNDIEIIALNRDSTFAVDTENGTQKWSADVQDCLIFPNHLGEVPMQVIHTTVQYAAYVNVKAVQESILHTCNEAYELLSKILVRKQHEHYSLSSAVGLVGYADTLKNGIVTPKDIERLAAPFMRNSFNIFPMSGSKLCAQYGISEGIWTSFNPLRILSNNKVVLSSDFVKYLREKKIDEFKHFVGQCDESVGYCFPKLSSNNDQLIEVATEYMLEKQNEYKKYFLCTPIDLQQEVIQTIQHCFYTTVPMPLYILPSDFRYVNSNKLLVECLHKIVIRNATKLCPILLPEIRCGASVLHEARKRRMLCKQKNLFSNKISCMSLKRKLRSNADFFDSFIAAGVDFLNGVLDSLNEFHGNFPVSSFALKCIEKIVNKKQAEH